MPRNRLKTLFFVSLFACFSLGGVTACDNNGNDDTFENAGEKLDNAGDKAAQKIDKAGEEMQDEADDATDDD